MNKERGFRIGSWKVSPLTGEIESADKTLHLEPKVMEVLVVLADQAESVVLRDELLEKVWGARAAISDEPLTRCIALLRQSLGDSSRSPTYIQTVPKRGYRLLVPAVSLAALSNAASETAGHRSGTQSSRNSTSKLNSWQSIGLIAALAIVGAIAWSITPFILTPDSTDGAGSCDIEKIERLESAINPEAHELCQQGADLMDKRTDEMLRTAMLKFQQAIEIDRHYGSAYVNLARSMVLLTIYDDFAECEVDGVVKNDCFEAAISLLEDGFSEAPYISVYSDGIKAYIATKQKRFSEALDFFTAAERNTGGDADMWQWNSQQRAAVGDLAGALRAIEQAYLLNPRSAVIADRFGVLLMWQNDLIGAAEKFGESDWLSAVSYRPSRIIFSIRNREWEKVEGLLKDEATLKQSEDDSWIAEYVAGVRYVQTGEGDEQIRAWAVSAFGAAVGRENLSGQYVYGGWVLLGEIERAMRAALTLVDNSPEEFNVEFLWVNETRQLRQHPGFVGLLEELGLVDYWRREDAHPELCDDPEEAVWCNLLF